jgi:hypothetical protein
VASSSAGLIGPSRYLGYDYNEFQQILSRLSTWRQNYFLIKRNLVNDRAAALKIFS